jgi:hypothetical protein
MKPPGFDDRRVRETLRRLAPQRAPRELGDQLRVLASREAARRRSRTSWTAWLRFAHAELSLRFHNLLQPLAVPFAGGLAAAMLLFGALVPSLMVQRVVGGDVPVNVMTPAVLASSMSFNLTDQDIVVDVSIDEHGRVTDYTIPAGQAWAANAALVRSLEITLLMTKFTPATFFGQPASGKTRITLRRSQLEVRG